MRTRIITTVLVLLAAASSYAETAPVHTGGVQPGVPAAGALSPAVEEKVRLFKLTGACPPGRPGTDAVASAAAPKLPASPSVRPY